MLKGHERAVTIKEIKECIVCTFSSPAMKSAVKNCKEQLALWVWNMMDYLALSVLSGSFVVFLNKTHMRRKTTNTHTLNQSLVLSWLAEISANILRRNSCILALAHPTLILFLLGKTAPEDLESLPYSLLADWWKHRTRKKNATRSIGNKCTKLIFVKCFNAFPICSISLSGIWRNGIGFLGICIKTA